MKHNAGSGKGFFDYGAFWFDHDDGSVFTKNPDEGTLSKAHEIAFRLRAKVQGDDGEVHLPNGEVVNGKVAERVVYPYWILLLCLASIACFIVTLFLVVTGHIK